MEGYAGPYLKVFQVLKGDTEEEIVRFTRVVCSLSCFYQHHDYCYAEGVVLSFSHGEMWCDCYEPLPARKAEGSCCGKVIPFPVRNHADA